MNETQALASWTANFKLPEIPQAIRDQARLFMLDNIGCLIAGALLPWSQSYYKVLTATRTGTHSTVAYFGDRLSPDDTAFINSAFTHSNESDGTHRRSNNHPGSVAVPAALALGEYANADGAKFLAAVIAAYEIQIRIAWSCAPFLIQRGHHPPVGVGPFGAAAAGAILMGFSPKKTLNAFAIAGSHSAGLVEYVKSGGSVKRAHSAIPTAAGVRAALFADAGITGPRSILEGEKGFCKVFAGEYDLKRLTEGLGSHFHLPDTALKPHSCNHGMHVVFDALDQMRAREPVTADQVKQVAVRTANPRLFVHLGSMIEPPDVLGAQFSLPFSIAMRLHHGGSGVRGGNGFWDYPNINLKDPALLATAHKVKCVVDKDGPWAEVDRAVAVDIETTDGRRIREIVLHSKGMPQNPMSAEEIRDKFRTLVDPILPAGRPQQIIDVVDNIENLRSVAELARLLVVDKPRRAV